MPPHYSVSLHTPNSASAPTPSLPLSPVKSPSNAVSLSQDNQLSTEAGRQRGTHRPRPGKGPRESELSGLASPGHEGPGQVGPPGSAGVSVTLRRYCPSRSGPLFKLAVRRSRPRPAVSESTRASCKEGSEEWPHLLQVKEILEKEGYQVDTAGGGKEGLEKLQKGGIDLALLDVMMPDMSGWEVFETIRKTDKDVKIAFLSIVEPSAEKRQRLEGQGLSDFINKPFTPKELIGRVKNIIGKK